MTKREYKYHKLNKKVTSEDGYVFNPMAVRIIVDKTLKWKVKPGTYKFRLN